MEVHAYLEIKGYQLYDVIVEHVSSDAMLQQADLLFVKKSSRLWSRKHTGIKPPANGWPVASSECTVKRNGGVGGGED